MCSALLEPPRRVRFRYQVGTTAPAREWRQLQSASQLGRGCFGKGVGLFGDDFALEFVVSVGHPQIDYCNSPGFGILLAKPVPIHGLSVNTSE